ncbi:HEAT repeat domain-containing protein [Streptomyces sp. NBC_00435]|uniref:HEAT repeat domain-containing protein n=1 Tax=Streptomyces sp. NBC_00435 TaxID=2903649 RepID=UPI002E1C538E
MNALNEALEALTSQSPRERDVRAAELGDLLRGSALSQAVAELIVSRLATLTISEPDYAVRESALNSICEAFNHHKLPLRLLEPLIPGLSTLEPELLKSSLYILGATQDRTAAETITPFLNHHDPEVREEAARALSEIAKGTEDNAIHNS